MAGALIKTRRGGVRDSRGTRDIATEARAPLDGCAEVADAIVRLETAGFASEAVRMMAHSLPKREGVWWACMCAANTDA